MTFFSATTPQQSTGQVKKAREGNERKKRERKKQRVAILVLIMATLKKKLNENRLFKCGNLFANPVRYVYIPRNIVIVTYNFLEYTRLLKVTRGIFHA